MRTRSPLRHDALIAALALACVSVTVTACGRTPAASGDTATEASVTDDASASSTSSAASVGSDSASTTGGDTTSGATSTTDDTGDTDDVGEPTACALALAYDEVQLELDTDSVRNPSLYTLDPGALDQPARLLLVQHEIVLDGHGNYKARELTLGPSWPDDVALTRPARALTHSGHAISRLAPAPAGGLAYLWNGDPDGTNKYDTFYSRLDLDAWTVVDEIEVRPQSNTSFVDLLATADGARFVATYTTDVYGESPPDQASGMSLAALDADGSPIAGPSELTFHTPEQSSGVRTFWAGDRVAVAISRNTCGQGQPLCVPHALVLARPDAPDESGAAVDGFTATHVFEGLPSTAHLSTARVFVHGDRTWLIWYESDDQTSIDEHRTMRALVLDALGAPTAPPTAFLHDTATNYWPTVFVSSLGVTVVYRDAVVNEPEGTTTRTFHVHHHDFDLEPLGEPLVIELLSSESGYPAMGALSDPRALLLAWGEELDYNDIALRLVRLTCR